MKSVFISGYPCYAIQIRKLENSLTDLGFRVQVSKIIDSTFIYTTLSEVIDIRVPGTDYYVFFCPFSEQNLSPYFCVEFTRTLDSIRFSHIGQMILTIGNHDFKHKKIINFLDADSVINFLKSNQKWHNRTITNHASGIYIEDDDGEV